MTEEKKVLPPVKRFSPYKEVFEVTLASENVLPSQATFTVFADSYVSARSYLTRMGFDAKLKWLGNAADVYSPSYEPDITIDNDGAEGEIANAFVNNYLKEKEKDDNSSECAGVGYESPYVVVTGAATE